MVILFALFFFCCRRASRYHWMEAKFNIYVVVVVFFLLWHFEQTSRHKDRNKRKAKEVKDRMAYERYGTAVKWPRTKEYAQMFWMVLPRRKHILFFRLCGLCNALGLWTIRSDGEWSYPSNQLPQRTDSAALNGACKQHAKREYVFQLKSSSFSIIIMMILYLVRI